MLRSRGCGGAGSQDSWAKEPRCCTLMLRPTGVPSVNPSAKMKTQLEGLPAGLCLREQVSVCVHDTSRKAPSS